MSIAGKWPGDETDAEIEEGLAWLKHDPHEGMMTRREVLEYVFEHPADQYEDSLSSYSRGFCIGCLFALGYRSGSTVDAAHELALMMDAEREAES